MQQDRFTESEKLQREVLESQTRLLGSSHKATLTTMDRLAYVLSKQGRYPESESIYRDVLEIRIREKGEDHIGTIAAMNNLASLYMEQDHFDDAVPLLERCLEITERTKPPGYMFKSVYQLNYGECLFKQKRYAEAEEHLLAAYPRGYNGQRLIIGFMATTH